MNAPSGIRLRPPSAADGAALHELVRRSPPLDLNSVYAYLLQGLHLADTCVVAETDSGLAGYVSAYLPPRTPDTLFVWQVAVAAAQRGRGLGLRMLQHLLARPGCAGVRWLETTVTPGNAASRRLFEKFAADQGCACRVRRLFTAASFGSPSHEEEELYRIGPLPRSG